MLAHADCRRGGYDENKNSSLADVAVSNICMQGKTDG